MAEVHITVQAQIMAVARIVKDMPLQEWIDKGEYADTVGPLLDPTLWNRAADNLQSLLALAKALRTFQLEVLKLEAVFWGDGRLD